MKLLSSLHRLFLSNKSCQLKQKMDTEPSYARNYHPIPRYIEANPSDYPLISVIATAIATGEGTNRQFIVKRIWQCNPEIIPITLLASSILASESSSKQLTIKNIYKQTQ